MDFDNWLRRSALDRVHDSVTKHTDAHVTGNFRRRCWRHSNDRRLVFRHQTSLFTKLEFPLTPTIILPTWCRLDRAVTNWFCPDAAVQRWLHPVTKLRYLIFRSGNRSWLFCCKPHFAASSTRARIPALAPPVLILPSHKPTVMFHSFVRCLALDHMRQFLIILGIYKLICVRRLRRHLACRFIRWDWTLAAAAACVVSSAHRPRSINEEAQRC